MKKNTIAALLISLIFVWFTAYPEVTAGASQSGAPCATMVCKNPKEAFQTLFAIIRKLSDDSRFEMTATLSAASFGYPEFAGVSRSENVSILFYDNFKSGVAAVCADEKSSIVNFLKSSNIPFERSDKWITIPFGDHANKELSQERARDAISATSKKLRGEVYAEITPDVLLSSFKNIPDDFPHKQTLNPFLELFSEIEKLELSLKLRGDEILYNLTFRAKSGSDIAAIFNSASARGEVKSLAYLPQDAIYTSIFTCDSAKLSAPISKVLDRILKPINPDIDVETLVKLFAQSGNNNVQTIEFSDRYGSNPFSGQQISYPASSININDYADSIAKYFKSSLGIKNPSLKTEINTGEIDGVKTVSMSLKLDDAELSTMYIALVGEFFLNASSEDELRGLIKRVKSPVPEDYPLKKYAKRDADITAIIRFDKLLKLINPKQPASGFQDLIISGKFIPNALEVSSAIKLDAIKALANSSVQLLDKKDADAVPDEK